MKKNPKSFYEELVKSLKTQAANQASQETINLSEAIKKIRIKKQISGVELCRKTGNKLDPRTLTAVEKGRIKNPSIQTLQIIASGLGVTVSDLFKTAEMNFPSHFFLGTGTQKGSCTVEFHRQGIKLVSFTPLIRDFFCGKLIFESRKKLEGSLLGNFFSMYLSVLVGRFEVTVEDRKVTLKEGENLFFNGLFNHSLQNISQREGALLLVTAPSLLMGE